MFYYKVIFSYINPITIIGINYLISSSEKDLIHENQYLSNEDKR